MQPSDPQEMRALLPDVARRGDELVIVRALKGAGLTVAGGHAVTVELHNGFRLVFTPAATGMDELPAWVISVPVPQPAVPDKHAQAHERLLAVFGFPSPSTPGRFRAIYQMHAHIESDSEVVDPVGHWFCEGPDPVALFDRALKWAIKSTGLPLQPMRKRGSRPRRGTHGDPGEGDAS